MPRFFSPLLATTVLSELPNAAKDLLPGGNGGPHVRQEVDLVNGVDGVQGQLVDAPALPRSVGQGWKSLPNGGLAPLLLSLGLAHAFARRLPGSTLRAALQDAPHR